MVRMLQVHSQDTLAVVLVVVQLVVMVAHQVVVMAARVELKPLVVKVRMVLEHTTPVILQAEL